MTVAEAAKVLGIERSAAYDAVHRGDIPALRIGRRILVPTAPIRAALGLDPVSPPQPMRQVTK